jgi:hypothetical protein
MQLLYSLALLTGLAVVSHRGWEKAQLAEKAVPVAKDADIDFALDGLESGDPYVAAKVPAPVSSLESGLPHVQKVSKQPILAMAESKEWFIYATALGKVDKGEPLLFISGYAIKRDGREVVGWTMRW